MIPTTINNGSNKKPKIGDEISTINAATSERRKITINQILNIFCIEKTK